MQIWSSEMYNWGACEKLNLNTCCPTVCKWVMRTGRWCASGHVACSVLAYLWLSNCFAQMSWDRDLYKINCKEWKVGNKGIIVWVIINIPCSLSALEKLLYNFFWLKRLEKDTISCPHEELKDSPFCRDHSEWSKLFRPLALQRLKFCGKGQKHSGFVWRHMYTTWMNYFCCNNTVSAFAPSWAIIAQSQEREREVRRAAPLAPREEAAETRGVIRSGEGNLTE